jgi:sugar-specific transcriptional regulator TrmB
MLQDFLKKMGFSEISAKVYITLLESGPSSLRQISEISGYPRATVYDNLQTLKERSLVLDNLGERKNIYRVDDVANLSHLAEERAQQYEDEAKKIAQLLPKIASRTEPSEPRIKLYSGTDGIKQVLSDLLWCENVETYTMWPISDMADILGVEYLENLNRRRIRKKICVKAIWPHDKGVKFKEFPFLGVGKKHLRQLRIAPKELTWEMSYWLYGDKVAFISSEKECFGFVINSRSFAGLIRAQFKVIWKISKPVKPQPRYTDRFLRTI